ncbi:MAG: hypothetical protein ACE5JG_06135 [Planctomycetota bacterium]
MRWLEWAGTAATVLILLCWVAPARFEIDVTQVYSIRVKDGDLSVRMWPVPRETDPYHSAGPDTYTLPLWLLLAVCVAAAGSLWRGDRARRAPPPTTCPACGREPA